MAPRLKVPGGLSIADKEKERETIIVSETSVDIDLLDLRSVMIIVIVSLINSLRKGYGLIDDVASYSST